MLKRVIPTNQWAAVTLLAALVFCLLLIRTCHRSRPLKGPSPPAVIVEVQGDVPHPGVHVLSGPTRTVSEALEAAGMKQAHSVRLVPEGIAQTPIESGRRIRVDRRPDSRAEVLVGNMDASARFALGFKLDVNTASEEDLLLLPLMKPEWAKVIVERRKETPWKTLEELDLIHGVGPKTIEKWRPHLEAIPPSP